MFKKLSFLLAVLSLVLALTACAGSTATNLTGAPDAILTQIVTDTTAAMPEANPVPKPLPNQAVTADNCTNIMGLSADDFNKYVDSASQSIAAIMTFPHEIILIQAKDAASAVKLKTLIADNYDSHKWQCVLPDESSVIDSGSYVMLVASRTDITDAAVAAFKNLAGTTGDLNTFYTSANDTSGAGGGLQLN